MDGNRKHVCGLQYEGYMDRDHMHGILKSGRWSVVYNQDFVKQLAMLLLALCIRV